jgi:hypothetical protein
VENQTGLYLRAIKPELTIRLPDQINAVPPLISRPHNQCIFTLDVRYNQRHATSKITHVRYSDKGKYLAGLIQVFGSFWNAKEFCDRRFWRHMFTKLANDDARHDRKLGHDITNLLKKRIPAHDTPERLTDRVLGLVRGRSKSGIALPYSAFKNELEQLSKVASPDQLNYPQGDTLVSHVGITQLTEEEMKRGLEELIELNVLRLGAYFRCLLCGIESWYHIDDLKQQEHCLGCGNKQSIGLQHEWYYALNSLVEMGVKQGQLYAMQAFAALASHSTSSFLYSPSLELFQSGSVEPWHEIDVSAIAQGEFVIGEVKGGNVTQSDFAELAEIAEVLRPQKAIIFLPLEKISDHVMKWNSESQARLSPKGIKAQIFALPTF